MKKNWIGWIPVLLAMQLTAQDKSAWQQHRSFVSFHAGLSFPIFCYASADFANKNAGFAKPGFTLNLNYSYRFNAYAGLAATVFYNSNKTDRDVQTDAGRYHYVGLLAGPLLRHKFSYRTDGDIRFMAGVARSISPKMIYQGTTILNEDRSTSFAWTAGLAFRYHFSGKTFLSFKADHTQLKPKYNNRFPEQAQKGEQHIVVMNLDAGLGLKF